VSSPRRGAERVVPSLKAFVHWYSEDEMLDDGTLSSKEAQDEIRKRNLRLDHIGLQVPGQVLRLDLYRMVCYFHSSKYFAGLSNGNDFCPWNGLRDEFQDSEIIRILLQTAVAMRFIGMGHADQMRGQRHLMEESVEGFSKRSMTALLKRGGCL
jgi:hypothetical protein